jgi:hypothetical protein
MMLKLIASNHIKKDQLEKFTAFLRSWRFGEIRKPLIYITGRLIYRHLPADPSDVR